MKNLTISEYGYIYHKEPKNLNSKFSHEKVSEKEWKELYQYWQENDDAKKVFEFDGYHLKALNYVGVIQTKSLSVEILPKIYDDKKEEDHRIIFIKMLKPLLDINEIQINKADLSITNNTNIYEMFITLFVQSIDTLIHKGIKSEYILREGNQFFLKGKLKFNQHIKQNYIHKERFYVETDEYLQDRTANRLLKSTISLLLKKTNSYDNKRKLRQQLFVFDEVQLSHNHEIDFKKVNKHRGMEHYDLPLRFAKVFLMHKSFTSMRGKDNVFALLFPMEKVFENYMEFVLNNSKNILGIKDIHINGRNDEYLLTNSKCNMARLQPDYLLEMNDGLDIVTDAKWKLFESKENETKGCDTVNISSGDVYQIFSYLHFYDCQNMAYLFVPKTEEFKESIEFTYLAEQNPKLPSGKKRIKIIPIDLVKLVAEDSKHILSKDIFKCQ